MKRGKPPKPTPARRPLPRFVDHREHLEAAWRGALEAARPEAVEDRLWRKFLPRTVSSDHLKVLAIGKASIEMAKALRQHLDTMPEFRHKAMRGLATCVPKRLTRQARFELGKLGIRGLAADHPLPTERNAKAARAVADFLETCDRTDTLLVLLSGGGSAHLASPIMGFGLERLSALSSDLMRSGATIHELNCVRKHLEYLKGGGAAKRCGAGRILVGVISDVIGDPLDVISSGPFAPDPTTFADALSTLRSRRLAERYPLADSIFKTCARAGVETPKPGDPVFRRVKHTVLLNNQSAVRGVANALQAAGFTRASETLNVEGESATSAAMWLLGELRAAARSPSMSLLGGETTVTVGESKGLGGPSQEFALAGAKVLARHTPKGKRAAVLTFSTDGVDGPTGAAGAIVTDEMWEAIRKAGIDPEKALANHDSHTALDAVGALIRTGPTGTNVNHVAALLIYDE